MIGQTGKCPFMNVCPPEKILSSSPNILVQASEYRHRFSLGFLNLCVSYTFTIFLSGEIIYVINPIKRLRKENHMFMSIHADKVANKIQYKPMTQFSQKTRSRGELLQKPHSSHCTLW